MMRVALFFDGKNHMKDLRRTAQDRWINHGELANWSVEHVGGTELFGAFYYTGVPTAHDENSDRHALSDLLEELEKRPGFFVKRFNRRASHRECPHCHESVHYTEEKMVDTTLVADMIMLAVQDAYDIAVVFSGDLDIAPALDAIRSLGKRAWIATFGGSGLSKSLNRAAWAHIDLLKHIDSYSLGELSDLAPSLPTPVASSDIDQEVHRELGRAEEHFAAGGGFVGAHYFIHRWKGHNIPDAPELRRQSLQRLLANGRVESYNVDGKTALKTTDKAVDFGMGSDSVPDLPLELDEEAAPPPASQDDALDPEQQETTVVRRIVRKR